MYCLHDAYMSSLGCWGVRLSGLSGPEGGWRGESFEEHLAADAPTLLLSPDLLQPSGLRKGISSHNLASPYHRALVAKQVSIFK